MSAVGAKLQTCNEQLVHMIEDLRRKLDVLDRDICGELKEKDKLTSQLENVKKDLNKVNESIDKKVALKNDYLETLNEVETAYVKILESSETLVSVVKMRSLKIEDKIPPL